MSTKDTDFVSHGIGERLKQIREKQGLSQRELARRAGITNGALSNIEQSKVSPSVLSLEKVLNAFPMSLQEFFSSDLELAPSVLKANQFVEIHKNHTDYHILPLNESGREGAYLSRQVLSPGAKITSEWMVSNGFIGGIVIVGTLELHLDGVNYILEEGDGFHFAIARPHAFINSSDRACELVGVSFSK